MYKPSLLAIAGLIAVCAALVLAQSSGAPDLPPGKMQERARAACMECHDAHIMIQQRLDRTAWTKEVDKMIKWGAAVNPGDRDAMIDYFSTNFPPDKAAEPAARVGSAK